jgi:hypothetical protein
VPHETIGPSAAASTAISLSKDAPSSVCRREMSRVLRRLRPPGQVVQRDLVGSDHPRPPAALDRHVAHRHPALHRQRLDRRARELDDVAGAPSTPIWPIVPRIRSLAVTPAAERARVADPHGARPGLHQALRGEHVLDLARADPEGQRPEGAVGRGVRVAADDGHPGLRDAELGADDVDDALVGRAQREDRDAELRAVALQRLDLRARERVADARGDRRAVGGTLWSAVASVRSGRRTLRPARRSPSKACGLVTSWTRCRSM